MLSDKAKILLQTLPTILSVKEVADFLGAHPMSVYRMIRERELMAFKDENHEWNILRDDLIKYCSKLSNL